MDDKEYIQRTTFITSSMLHKEKIFGLPFDNISGNLESNPQYNLKFLKSWVCVDLLQFDQNLTITTPSLLGFNRRPGNRRLLVIWIVEYKLWYSLDRKAECRQKAILQCGFCNTQIQEGYKESSCLVS